MFFEKTILTSGRHGHLTLVPGVSPWWYVGENTFSFVATLKTVTINLHEARYDGFTVWQIDIKLEEDDSITFVNAGQAFLGLAFVFSNDMPYVANGTHEVIAKKYRYNFYSVPDIHCRFNLARGEYGLFGINFTRLYLERFMFRVSPVTCFQRKVCGGTPMKITEEDAALTSRMMQTITAIPAKSPDVYSLLRVETRVLDLLWLSAEGIAACRENMSSLTEREVEEMREVREYTVKNFKSITSLSDLVRRVGTNEFKLQHTFKKLYGISAYCLVTKLKMDHARILLAHTSLTVKDVAAMAGYKNLPNFTASFRKWFGRAPIAFKEW